MSFSSRVKEELSRQLSSARHCQIAEIAAILSLCGRIHIDEEDHYSIRIHTENVAVARKYFTLLKKAFNIGTDISIRRNAFLKKNRTYTVVIRKHEDAIRVLEACKLLDEHGEVWENLSVVKNLVVQNPCCRRAFIKEGSQIVEILGVMEAHVALMDLENIRILKEMRNSVNRQVNCETANINKTVSAAVKQLGDITYIRDTVGLDYLPETLAEIAEVRLDRPDATLKELGESLDPQVGKSGVNHRLRKISTIAENLRAQKELV